MRGISASQTYAPQPVSVFVDGVYKRDGALGLLLDDAERVEVIKGPQSALYGRATYAGAINYVTVKPSQEINGTVSVTVGQAGEASAFGRFPFPLSRTCLRRASRPNIMNLTDSIPMPSPATRLARNAPMWWG